MSTSSVTYDGDGSTTQFTIPFGYINRADVTAEVDDAPTSFTWVSSTLVEFASAPANGSDNVVFTRTTNRTTPEVSFEDGSIPTAAENNRAILQCFYLAQEYINNALIDITITEGDIAFGTYASLPAPSLANKLYVATDTGAIYRDTGASWVILTPAFTGDVTKAVGGTVTTIANNAVTSAKILADAITTAKILDANVTLAKLANLAAATVIGSVAGGVPAALTATQVTASLVNDATTSLPGRVELATGAENQTGTDAGRAVCPSTQGSHLSACKAWFVLTTSGGTVTLRDSYGVASITDNGVGDYTVNFTTAFATAYYSASIIVQGLSSDNSATAVCAYGVPPTTSAYRFTSLNGAGNKVDSTLISGQFFGRQ